MNQRRLILINHGNYINLPKDLIVSSGTLWEDFETFADWSGSGVEAANITQFKTGTQSMKSTIAASSWKDIWKLVTWDLSGDWKQLRFWSYYHDTDMTHYASNYVFQLWTGAAYYKCNPPINMCNYKTGWNYITLAKNSFSVSGVPDWAAIDKLYFASNAYAGGSVAVSYDNLMVGVKSKPCVLYSFDDGDITQYVEAFGYLKSLGIRGTLYMLGIWLNDGTHLTTAQILEMQTAGWTIANHTHNHPDLTTLTEAQQETELALGKATLDAIGITGGHYVAYPLGKLNEDTRTAMTALGYRLGSSTQPTASYLGNAYPSLTLPLGDPWNLGRTNIYNGITLAAAKAMKDQIIENGAVWTPYFHSLGTGAPNWTVADFKALVDYRRSEIAHITIDDLYKLTFGPIRVPKVF